MPTLTTLWHKRRLKKTNKVLKIITMSGDFFNANSKTNVENRLEAYNINSQDAPIDLIILTLLRAHSR